MRRHLDRARAEEVPGASSTASRRSSRTSPSSTPRAATTRRRCSSTAIAGRQSARSRGGRRSRASSSTSSARKAAQADRRSRSRRWPRTTHPSWVTLGTFNGKLYGLVFKGANKSTVWYNVSAFKNAGVKPPKTWPAAADGGQDAAGLGHAGVLDRAAPTAGRSPTCSRTSTCARPGPTKYDQLSTHTIKWTDPSVKAALKTMAQVFGDTATSPAARRGALQTDFPTSVNNVFSDPAEGRDGDRGRLRARRVATDEGQAGHGLQRVPVPVGRRLAPSVVGGGDTVVMFKDTPGGPRAHQVPGDAPRRRRSGPSAAASRRRTRTCRRAPTRTRSRARPRRRSRSAKTFRFDMSDLAPAAFGGTAGPGRVEDPPGLPQEPDGRRRHRRAARDGRRGRRTSSSDVSSGRASRAEPPSAGAPPDAGRPGRLWRGYAGRGRLPRARADLPGRLDRLSRPSTRSWRSFFDRDGRQLHLVRQLPRRSSRRHDRARRSRTTRSGWPSCRRS